MQLPYKLWQILEAHAERFPQKELAAAAAALSGNYREGGVTPPGEGLPQSAIRTAAYAITRLPATYVAARVVLGEASRRLAGAEVRTLLDLGAGPAAATLAAGEVFPEIEQATLIEKNHPLAAIGEELLEALLPGRSRWWKRDMTSPVFDYPAADLVVISYALGELGADATRILSRAWAAAKLALVLIEPGSQEGFAVVRSARSQLVEEGATLAAPCPWDGPCPVIAPDWCHFAGRLERPALYRRLKGGSLPFEDEKFSYAVFARGGCGKPAAGRIVRRPDHHPGLIELHVCEGPRIGVHKVSRRDKQSFRKARKSGWGDAWPPGEQEEHTM